MRDIPISERTSFAHFFNEDQKDARIAELERQLVETQSIVAHDYQHIEMLERQIAATQPVPAEQERIKTWQERMVAPLPFERQDNASKLFFMQAEIADLRAALAALQAGKE